MSDTSVKGPGTTTSVAPDSADDISHLWEQAIRKYHTLTGKDLYQEWSQKRSDRGPTVDTMVAFLTENETTFSKWRHNDGKLDKVRSALKRCLGPLDGLGKVVSDCGSLAWPPSSAIFTSVSYLIQVFNNVSADYDTLAAFFEDLHLYLDRLKILDGNVPTPPTIQRCLTDILTLVLVIIGISTRNIKEGRGIKFLKKIIPVEDKELVDSYAQLKKLVEQEEKLIGNQTLVNSALTLRKLEQLSTLDEKLDQNLEAVQGVGEQIAGLQRSIEKQNVVDDIEKIKEYFNPQTADEYDRNLGFLIKDTTAWVFQEEAYKAWADGTSSVLWISGAPGTGKSFISTSIIKYLLSGQRHQSPPGGRDGDLVAYYYFRNGDIEKRSVLNALACMAFQLATRDEDFAKYAAAMCVRSVPFARSAVNILWRDFFASAFPSDEGSKPCLFLVFDGLDEADREQIINLIHAISATLKSSRIKIVLLGRPELTLEIISLGDTAPEPGTVASLEISSEKNKMDIMRYIKRGFTLYSSLRTPQIRPYQKKIAMTLLDNSNGMFIWVELMFKSLSQVSGAAKVLKALQSPPQGLDELYSRILENIFANSKGEHSGLILPELFCWIGHWKEPLSLRQLEILCRASKRGASAGQELNLERAVLTTYSSLLRQEKTGTALFDEIAKGMSHDDEANAEQEIASEKTVIDTIAFSPMAEGEALDDIDADDFFSDLGSNEADEIASDDGIEQNIKALNIDETLDSQLLEYQRNVLVGLRHASLGDFLRQPPARLVPHILFTPTQAYSHMAQVALRILTSPNAELEAWVFALKCWLPLLKELSPEKDHLPDDEVAPIVESLLDIFYRFGPKQTHIIRQLPRRLDWECFPFGLGKNPELVMVVEWFKQGLARRNVLDPIQAEDGAVVSWMRDLANNPTNLTKMVGRACIDEVFGRDEVTSTIRLWRVFLLGWRMLLSSDPDPPEIDCEETPGWTARIKYVMEVVGHDHDTPIYNPIFACCRTAKLLAHGSETKAAIMEYRKAEKMVQGSGEQDREKLLPTLLDIATAHAGDLGYDGKIALLEEYIAQDDASASAYTRLGYAKIPAPGKDEKIRHERTAAAESSFVKALAIDPKQCIAAREYISLLDEQDRHSEICDLFEQYPGQDGCELWIRHYIEYPSFNDSLMRAGAAEQRLQIFENAFNSIMHRNIRTGTGLHFTHDDYDEWYFGPGHRDKKVHPKETALLCGNALAVLYLKYKGDSQKAFELYQNLIFNSEFLKICQVAEIKNQVKKLLPKACKHFAELIFEKAIHAEESGLKDSYLKMLVRLASLQIASETLTGKSALYSQFNLNTLLARLYLSGKDVQNGQKSGKAEAMNLLRAEFNKVMEILQDDDVGNDYMGYRTLSKILDLVGREYDAKLALSLSQMEEFDVGDAPGQSMDPDKSEAHEPTRPGYYRCAFGDECPHTDSRQYQANCRPPILYTCKTCIKVDFCTGCYEYLKGRRPEESRLIYVCNADHEFLKTPVDKWRGVTKENVILFDDKERLPVKEWLDRIKEDFESGKIIL